MDILKIIFWVCVVESVMGHLSWTAPLAIFGVVMLLNILSDKKNKKDNKELNEKIKKMGRRRR